MSAQILEALREAATSLRTIAREAGKGDHLADAVNVRAYANSRATVAESALAALAAAEAQPAISSECDSPRMCRTAGGCLGQQGTLRKCSLYAAPAAPAQAPDALNAELLAALQAADYAMACSGILACHGVRKQISEAIAKSGAAR